MAANYALLDERIRNKTENHPCFHCGAAGNARIHLPIAPACNIQCNYCVRKFDCVNESRPGVASSVLTPEQAIARFEAVKKEIPNLTVVGIAGPGDALANFDQVREVLQSIRKIDPKVTFCLSTNGLMLPFYMNHLISLDVTHVTVTVNTVDSATGAKIYDHVNYLGKKYTGEAGAALLLQNQLSGINYLASMGVVVKVNIVLLKGINDEEIDEIVFTVRDCGAAITNIMQLIPVAGSAFQNMEIVPTAELNRIRKGAAVLLPQMYHCKQCRADAVGTLAHDISIRYAKGTAPTLPVKEEMAPLAPVGEAARPLRFAVCSKDGTVVDEHFGRVEKFYIFDYNGGGAIFKEIREHKPYCSGPEKEEDAKELGDVIELLADCDGLLCMRIGPFPARTLRRGGIRVFTTYNYVKQGLAKAAGVMAKEKSRDDDDRKQVTL